MFISEVIIDGFKSYATRTVVSGFDPQFNAITGLNGSGKSNILDSICFVLGISNLRQVGFTPRRGQRGAGRGGQAATPRDAALRGARCYAAVATLAAVLAIPVAMGSSLLCS